MRIGRSGDVDVVGRDCVGREAVEDTITIRITIEVVVETEDVQLHVGGPSSHDIQFPSVLVVEFHHEVDAFIETPVVERATNHELGHTTRRSIVHGV